MTYEQYVHEAYDVSDDGSIGFTCANCDSFIFSDELVSPCHQDDGFVEGSGHGGYSGMSIYCIPNSGDCEWGGSLKDYEPLLLCGKCKKSPFNV